MGADRGGRAGRAPRVMKRELAWSNRRLVFESDTVADAVEEFNRRNRVQIILEGALGTEQVRGVFHADDPMSFAESLAAARKNLAVSQSGDVIRLQPRPATASP